MLGRLKSVLLLKKLKVMTDSASLEESSSVDSDEYATSTGWDSHGEDKDGVHDEKVKKPKKRVQRTLHSCPLKGCKSKVIHLPPHLRGVHKWSKEQAKKATSRFGLTKSFLPKVIEKKVAQSPGKTVQEKKRKDYHLHRRCPVNGCNSVVKRLSNHIQQVHKEIKKRLSCLQTAIKRSPLPQDLAIITHCTRQPQC